MGSNATPRLQISTQLRIEPINPFTPESHQCQNSPAASQEIWHHTVWRTWLFIAYSDEKWLYYKFSLHHSYNRFLKGWENTLFELRSERVKQTGALSNTCSYHLVSWVFFFFICMAAIVHRKAWACHYRVKLKCNAKTTLSCCRNSNGKSPHFPRYLRSKLTTENHSFPMIFRKHTQGQGPSCDVTHGTGNKCSSSSILLF